MSDNSLKAIEETGCRQINLGIEKGTSQALRVFKKGYSLDKVRKACERLATTRMRVAGTFILGGPGETEADLDETIDFAVSLPLDFAQFNPLAVIPGTELYQRIFPSFKDNEWLDLSLDRNLSPKGDILWQSEKLELKEIASKIVFGYSRFYSKERLSRLSAKLKLSNQKKIEELYRTYEYLREDRGTYLLKTIESV